MEEEGPFPMDGIRPLEGCLSHRRAALMCFQGGGEDFQVLPKLVEFPEGLAVKGAGEPAVPLHGVEDPHRFREGEGACRVGLSLGEDFSGQVRKVLPEEDLEEAAGF